MDNRGPRRFLLQMPILLGALVLGACSGPFVTSYSDIETTGSLGQTAQSITILGDQLAVDPNDRIALNERGNAYLSQKEYGLALTDLNRSIGLDANQPHIIYRRAMIYQAQGLHVLAIGEFTRAIKLDGTIAALHQGRAMSYFLTNEMALALVDLDATVVLDADMADAWAMRGLVLETVERRLDARTSYNQALKIDAGQKIARAGARRLNLLSTGEAFDG